MYVSKVATVPLTQKFIYSIKIKTVRMFNRKIKDTDTLY